MFYSRYCKHLAQVCYKQKVGICQRSEAKKSASTHPPLGAYLVHERHIPCQAGCFFFSISQLRCLFFFFFRYHSRRNYSTSAVWSSQLCFRGPYISLHSGFWKMKGMTPVCCWVRLAGGTLATSATISFSGHSHAWTVPPECPPICSTSAHSRDKSN